MKGDAEKRIVYAHDKFVEPKLDYIVQDFEKARIAMNEDSIGALVDHDSSDQAKKMNEIFLEKYAEKRKESLTRQHSQQTFLDDNRFSNSAEHKLKLSKFQMISFTPNIALYVKIS